MDTRHLIDSELLPLLEFFPTPCVTREGITTYRSEVQHLSMSARPNTAPDASVLRSEQRVPGPKGAPPVRVLIYRPAAANGLLPAMLHVHGGGYIVGSPEGSDPRLRMLVSSVNCIIVSVDYRLPPETPHPGPIEDSYAALHWLYTHAEELGVDRKRIAIGGESAGGGLAASLALLTRDRGEIPLVFQMLIYPMLDDRVGTRSDEHPYTGEFIWTPASNRLGWSCLLGHAPGAAGVSPYAAAARAESLAGLPPAFIAVGALDLFLEEDIEYARRLLRAGVPTELHVYPGAYHGFDVAVHAQVTQSFFQMLEGALRRALHS